MLKPNIAFLAVTLVSSLSHNCHRNPCSCKHMFIGSTHEHLNTDMPEHHLYQANQAFLIVSTYLTGTQQKDSKPTP